MKTLLIGMTLLGMLTACSDGDQVEPENARTDANSEQYLHKWQLVEMSGSIANVPPATGDDMTWQEYYLLYEDNTFVKSRTRDGVETEARGTYAIVTLEDGEYLELTYSSENELIGNCSGEPEELLFFESESKLIGTWWACDGPGLVYEKAGEDSSGDDL